MPNAYHQRMNGVNAAWLLKVKGDAAPAASCYVNAVNAAEIVTRLKAMEPELRSAGLDALYLFGSRARGDARPDSDVDLAYDLTEEADLRFSYFDQFALEDQITAALRTSIDLIMRRSLRDPIRRNVEPDLMQVF
ncbi:nucleotidyltransferase family protein [uncultured Sphingomonas sp.]|uniref:nucleotidyltransferase family protein n=1 Tax=uncultured Sphingomonas sp. TaxID=158754 RepID=UPI0035CB7EE9